MKFLTYSSIKDEVGLLEGEQDFLLAYAFGHAYAVSKKFDEAILFFKKALAVCDLYPNDSLWQERAVKIQLELANVLQECERFSLAIDYSPHTPWSMVQNNLCQEYCELSGT